MKKSKLGGKSKPKLCHPLLRSDMSVGDVMPALDAFMSLVPLSDQIDILRAHKMRLRIIGIIEKRGLQGMFLSLFKYYLDSNLVEKGKNREYQAVALTLQQLDRLSH